MTTKISTGRAKKVVQSGKVSALKKGRAVQTKKVGEKVNGLRTVARSVKVK